MPDITMCSGHNCPHKEKCYRYKAAPNEYWQSYFTVAPYVEGQDCNYYWPIEIETKAERKKSNEKRAKQSLS